MHHAHVPVHAPAPPRRPAGFRRAPGTATAAARLVFSRGTDRRVPDAAGVPAVPAAGSPAPRVLLAA